MSNNSATLCHCIAVSIISICAAADAGFADTEAPVEKGIAINATVEEAWQMIATSSGLSSWASPSSYVELEVGGAYDTYLSEGEGCVPQSRILGYMPLRSLAFTGFIPGTWFEWRIGESDGTTTRVSLRVRDDRLEPIREVFYSERFFDLELSGLASVSKGSQPGKSLSIRQSIPSKNSLRETLLGVFKEASEERDNRLDPRLVALAFDMIEAGTIRLLADGFDREKILNAESATRRLAAEIVRGSKLGIPDKGIREFMSRFCPVYPYC